MEYRSGTQHDVQAGVDLTEEGAEVPASLHGSDHAVRHHYEADEAVSHRERHNKRVRGRLQLLEVGDRQDNQEVSHHRGDDANGEEAVQKNAGEWAP